MIEKISTKVLYKRFNLKVFTFENVFEIHLTMLFYSGLLLQKLRYKRQ